jgi:hypothetical protein
MLMQLTLRQMFLVLLSIAFLTAVVTAGNDLDRMGAAALVGFCLSTLLAISLLRSDYSRGVRLMVWIIQGILVVAAVAVVGVFVAAWLRR